MAFYNIYIPENSAKSDISHNTHGTVNLNRHNKIESYLEFFKTPSYHPYSFSLTLTSIDHSNVSAPYCFTLFTFDFVFNIALSEAELPIFKSITAAHNHNNYQLIYVLSGNFTQTIEQEQHTYHTNDACFLIE